MNSQAAPRDRPSITDWIQAIGAVLALAVAVWAGAVAVDAFRDQQAINRDQQAMFAQDRLRQQQRYASRVAFWTVDADAAAAGNERLVEALRIQNRSPVPLRGVVLRLTDNQAGTEGLLFHASHDVPPCTIVAVRVEADDPAGADFIRGGIGQGDRWELYFSDSFGSWAITGTGLQAQPPPVEPSDSGYPSDTFAVAGPNIQDAADCGEGG